MLIESYEMQRASVVDKMLLDLKESMFRARDFSIEYNTAVEEGDLGELREIGRVTITIDFGRKEPYDG